MTQIGPFYPDIIRQIASSDIRTFNRLLRLCKYYYEIVKPLLTIYAWSDISIHEATQYIQLTHSNNSCEAHELNFRDSIDYSRPYLDGPIIFENILRTTVDNLYLYKYGACVKLNRDDCYSTIETLLQADKEISLASLYLLLCRRLSACKFYGKDFPEEYVKEVVIRRYHLLLKETSLHFDDNRLKALIKYQCHDYAFYYHHGNLPWDEDMHIQDADHPMYTHILRKCRLLTILTNRVMDIVEDIQFPQMYAARSDSLKKSISAKIDVINKWIEEHPFRTTQK